LQKPHSSLFLERFGAILQSIRVLGKEGKVQVKYSSIEVFTTKPCNIYPKPRSEVDPTLYISVYSKHLIAHSTEKDYSKYMYTLLETMSYGLTLKQDYLETTIGL